ncbi:MULTISPECIES: 3-hydroxyacyl-ACP dehydratase FabZ [Youngiibacter]|jgi:3-hydroxyacyl-[acyl-carrier-protein] dehydratase|uniref:3-hydroxyacyl-[acyl-carrier-protein] dehydratase FabZ n=2 Tax=Youngiibacter TaxID=1408818 RepID=V7I2Z8_9CLOT|nr:MULTISPECIES: 3-hydroxyacyl-ACP dehydratase FabZ [Youngiibacter]ETA80248.1 3-hydroxyacyl-ACP dehydratase [Youngiibacter fragilis 232.1]MBP1918815.1 3-hydroxyacyl-[acyl-carrier-protein] dehydratase [Youngiibacter multivorans]MBW8383912.1 3-hydroxyacyl-ACP dehydratase FabZ [Youngiibacter sp.]
MMDINEIMKTIPHRQPFLLIDRVDEVRPGEYCRAIKNVTMNEDFFRGHYPEHPVMPGVLIVEAMAQTGAVGILSMESMKGKMPFFAGLDKVKFRKQVRPGDTLTLEVNITKLKSTFGKGTGKAFVNGEVVCEGELLFVLG